jgi:Tol biopolymer transport system component
MRESIGAIAYLFRSHFRSRGPEVPFQNFTITKVTDTGNLTEAAISPDGKYIVYAVKENGMEGLWLKNLATNSGTQVIAPTRTHYGSVEFSPDGDYIYFRRLEMSIGGDLYRAPVLGGNPHLAARNVWSGISFSRNGQRISFMRWATEPKDGKPPPMKLVTASSEGGEDKELLSFDLSGFFQSRPAWSPDDKVIVTSQDEADGSSKLIAVGIESGKPSVIIDSTVLSFAAPVWLPNESGLVVLYSERKANASQPQIGFVSYPEKKFRAITRDTSSYSGLSVSRDGKTLTTVQLEQSFRLYLMSSRDKSEESGTAITPRGLAYQFSWGDEHNLILADVKNVFRMNDRGEGKNLLLETWSDALDQAASCQSGRYVVFSSADPKSSMGNRILWRADTTNNEIIKLTDGEFDASPACSPDGKWIYYVQFNSQQTKLQKVALEGGASKAVIGMFVLPLGIDVSRDGRLLAFFSGEEIGAVDIETGRVVGKFARDPRWGSSNGQSPYPRFTVDSKALAYIVHVNGVDNIWAQPLDGSTAYPITSFKSDEISDFHWSPSGDRLGVVRGRTDSNVVLIRQANP